LAILHNLVKRFRKKEDPFKTMTLEYDDEVISTLAKSHLELNRKTLGLKKITFGVKEYLDYLYDLKKLEITLDLCDKRMWNNKSDWVEHKVPLTQLFQKMIISCKVFCDQHKKFLEVEFRRRQRSHL